MENIAKADVATVVFPFSDLRHTKMRPALVLAKAEFADLILCQITSKPYSSKIAIKLSSTDFSSGQLSVSSYIRPDRLFTADPGLVARRVGHLHAETMTKVLLQIQAILGQ